MDVRIGVVEHTLLQVNLQTNQKRDCSEITKTKGSQISEQSLQNKIYKIDFSFCCILTSNKFKHSMLKNVKTEHDQKFYKNSSRV